MPLFSGQQANSNREGFPAYVADRLTAVKWRNWKMHFIQQDEMYDPPLPLAFPRLYNLLADLREEHDVMLENTWALQPMMGVVGRFKASLEQYPPIESGTPDPYLPAAR
ncbi:hypothetical protein D3C80_1584000 [compost metagenome]